VAVEVYDRRGKEGITAENVRGPGPAKPIENEV